MVQNISGKLNLNYINDNPLDKVKKENITALAKQIKNVKNSYNQLKSNRAITGKFEVNYFNEGQLKNISRQLTGLREQAQIGYKKINSDQYQEKYNHNKAKLKQLEKLFIKANKLKAEIDKKLSNYNNENRLTEISWKYKNNPDELKIQQDQLNQKRIDALKGDFQGGMVK